MTCRIILKIKCNYICKASTTMFGHISRRHNKWELSVILPDIWLMFENIFCDGSFYSFGIHTNLLLPDLGNIPLHIKLKSCTFLCTQSMHMASYAWRGEGAEGERGQILWCSLQGQDPTLKTSYDPSYLPKAASPNTITLGLRLQCVSFEGTQLGSE